MASEREELNPLEAARALLPTLGFEYHSYGDYWRREKDGIDGIDKVEVYPNMMRDGGEFKVRLYGDLKDLPATLQGYTLERVEVAMRHVLSDELPADEFTNGDIEKLVAVVLSRLKA